MSTASVFQSMGVRRVAIAGGVASNSILRRTMKDAYFAPPEYSRDNAMGIAILARRALERGEAHGK